MMLLLDTDEKAQGFEDGLAACRLETQELKNSLSVRKSGNLASVLGGAARSLQGNLLAKLLM